MDSSGTSTYRIPPEIKSKIPGYFFAALAGELFAIYDMSVFDKDEDGIPEFTYHAGSFAWGFAFWMACKKCDMKWLFDYYDGLEWYESDCFDSEICGGIESYLSGDDWRSTVGHEYYSYLCNYKAEEDGGYPRWMK